jgi:hypothetical protein
VPCTIAAAASACGTLEVSGLKKWLAPWALKSLEAPWVLILQLVQKNCHAHQELPHSHDWRYGRGIFGRVSGVIAARSDDQGFDVQNCPEVGASWSIFRSLAA